jgi:hypothetical protein
MRGEMRNRRDRRKGSVNKFDFDYAQRVFRLFNKSSKASKSKKLLMVGGAEERLGNVKEKPVENRSEADVHLA